MLEPQDVSLLVVDLQGKLVSLMSGKEQLIENVRRLIKGMKILEVPIIWVEQNPSGLGPTVTEIAELMPELDPLEKMTFSCCGNQRVLNSIRATERKHVLLSGIETHVCIYQTAIELMELGYGVEVVADAVSSRRESDKRVSIQRILSQGAGITSTEMVLFELLKIAQGDRFKSILKLVK